MAVSKIEIKINPQLGIIRIYNDAKEEITFGMSQTEVADILGDSTQYTVNRARGSVVEPRDGMQFTYILLKNVV